MSRALDPARSLLLVVDVQTRLHPAIHDGAAALARAARLVAIARLLSIPAWGTEHCPDALGPLHPALRDDLDRVFAKTRFDACGAPGLIEALPPDRPEVILCGYEAHVCVLQTALGLIGRGHRVLLARDAAGSRDPADRDAGFARLAAAGVEFITTEMAAFEWLGDATHPRFREVLRLIK